MDCVACFDIGGTFIKYGLINDQGEILIKGKEITPEQNCKELIPKIIINKVKEHRGKYNIRAVGVSTAGNVDNEKGEIIFASENLPDYTGAKISQYVYEGTGLKCTVENDVNAAAMGELWKGAAIDRDTFFCMTLGTGIGGAIVINRKLHRGVGGNAGEVGHMVINNNSDEPCVCGMNGCYERYGSTAALIRSYEKELAIQGVPIDKNKLDGKYLMNKVSEKEPIALKVYDEFLDNVVVGIAGITHIFDPGLIVIGGGISSQGDFFFNEINRRFREKIMPSYVGYTEVVQAKLGNDAGLFGAYYLANQ